MPHQASALTRTVRRPRRIGDELVHEGTKIALRYKRGIQVPHAPGRGVAGVGVERIPCVLELAVDPLERGARQVDLAAHFDASARYAVAATRLRPCRSAEGERNRANGAHVHGDVCAARAIAARRAADQAAALVGQGDAQAVDLQLGDVRDRFVAQAGALPDAFIECAQLTLVVGIVEAEHGQEMLDGLEPFDRAAGDALGRRIGRDEIGMIRLEMLEFVQEPIELLVGHLRVVVDVIALLVMPDGIPESLEAFLRRRHVNADVYRSLDKT